MIIRNCSEQLTARLSAIFTEEAYGIMSATNVTVIEAEGSTAQRLRIIEKAMLSKPA